MSTNCNWCIYSADIWTFKCWANYINNTSRYSPCEMKKKIIGFLGFSLSLYLCVCVCVCKCVSYRNSPNDNWLQSKPHLFVVKILDCKSLSNLIPIWMHRHESKPSPVSMYRAWCLSYKRKDVDNFHFQWIFVILSRLGMRSNHRDQIADWWFHWMVPMATDPAI